MGQKKGNESTCPDYKKERRNYRCGKKKAFTANEGAVGGKKENRKEVKVAKRRPADLILVRRMRLAP